VSPACWVANHDRCDGTAPGNAADDEAFMTALRESALQVYCDCRCHRLGVMA